MARARHHLFISTNPQDNVPIGLPGQGVFIGYPGRMIFSQSEQIIGDGLITESALANLITESAGDTLITEGG